MIIQTKCHTFQPPIRSYPKSQLLIIYSELTINQYSSGASQLIPTPQLQLHYPQQFGVTAWRDWVLTNTWKLTTGSNLQVHWMQLNVFICRHAVHRRCVHITTSLAAVGSATLYWISLYRFQFRLGSLNVLSFISADSVFNPTLSEDPIKT
jgi:hypothetical protein